MKKYFFQDFFKYLSVFTKTFKIPVYFSVALSLLRTLTESIGLSLFFPLFSLSQGTPDHSGKATLIMTSIFHWLGLELTFKSVLGVMVIAFFFKGLTKFAELGSQAYLQANFIYKINRDLFRAFSGTTYHYYKELNVGHITHLMVSEAARATEAFKQFVLVFSGAVSAAAFVFVSFYVNFKMTALALGVGSIVPIFLKFLPRRTRELSYEYSRLYKKLEALLIQFLHAFKYLKTTAKFPWVEGILEMELTSIKKLRLISGIYGSLSSSLFEPIIMLVLVAIIYGEVVYMHLSLSYVMVSMLFLYKVLMTLIGVQNSWQSFCGSMGSLDQILDAFVSLEKNRDHMQNGAQFSLKEALAFEKVSFSYGNKIILSNASFKISVNTTVALVGESGMGKSTLIDLLSGLLKPDAGQILIDGIPLSSLDLHSYRSSLGFVSQESPLFDDTVLYNISLQLSPRQEDLERARAAAQRAGCDGFISEMPQGYNTHIGDRGVRLSGGQKQRLAIARELYKNPKVLILDEATSSLDAASEKLVQSSIDALRGSMTVIIIAHRLSTIKNADHIFVIENGKIIEQGTFSELLRQGGSRFQAMCDLQSLSEDGNNARR